MGRSRSWSPAGDLNGEKGNSSQKKRATIAVGLSLIAWVGAIYMGQQEEPSGSISIEKKGSDYNQVKIVNDSDLSIYFVECSDQFCNDAPNGTRPGDYNLITKGNSQEVPVKRGDNKLSNFGVYANDRKKQGCISINSSSKKEPVKEAKLSELMVSCGGDLSKDVSSA